MTKWLFLIIYLFYSKILSFYLICSEPPFLFLFYFNLKGETYDCPLTVKLLFGTDMIENRGLLPESYS